MAEKPGASLKIWQVFRENDDETMDGTSFSHFRTLDPKNEETSLSIEFFVGKFPSLPDLFWDCRHVFSIVPNDWVKLPFGRVGVIESTGLLITSASVLYTSQIISTHSFKNKSLPLRGQITIL